MNKAHVSEVFKTCSGFVSYVQSTDDRFIGMNIMVDDIYDITSWFYSTDSDGGVAYPGYNLSMPIKKENSTLTVSFPSG